MARFEFENPTQMSCNRICSKFLKQVSRTLVNQNIDTYEKIGVQGRGHKISTCHWYTGVKGVSVDFEIKGVLEVFYHVTSKHSTLVETNVLAHFFRRLSDNSNRYYGRSSKYVIIEF